MELDLYPFDFNQTQKKKSGATLFNQTGLRCETILLGTLYSGLERNPVQKIYSR